MLEISEKNNDEDLTDDNDDNTDNIYKKFDEIPSKFDPLTIDLYDDEVIEIFEKVMNLLLIMFDFGMGGIKLQIKEQIFDKKFSMHISLE